jgi:3',5'-cyclic AMP phosphodiesterase CpdA
MNREEFLECMAWCGTGVVYGLSGAGMVGRALADDSTGAMPLPDRTFVQISDSHIGFNGKANQDVIATFSQAIDKINALPKPPEFVIHTGDLTHLAKPEQLDTVKQMLGTIKAGAVYAVPGEHDVIEDGGAEFFKTFGHPSGNRWFSFDAAGVHSLALTNVVDITKGGILGRDQLEWARADLAKQRPDTPIVVMAHIPLYAVYPDWGWTTDDQMELIDQLRRFDNVTVLNGHIHQVLSKVDGKITFYTAASTAFPQPKPGTAPNPGPLKVPAGELGHLLGIRTVTVHGVSHEIAVAGSSLAS